MKATTWFHAMGQRDEARGVLYRPMREAMNAWPLWAKRAYCAGRLAEPSKPLTTHAAWDERAAAGADYCEHVMTEPDEARARAKDEVLQQMCVRLSAYPLRP